MLSMSRKTAVERLVYEVDDLQERLRSVASFGPEELEYCLDIYNWDDGFAIPAAIAQHPACDQALALQLFWLAEGLSWYTRESEPEPWHQEWDAFCRMITEGILSGRYPLGDLSFDPGLTRVEQYQLRKTDIPEVLYLPVVGKRSQGSPPDQGEGDRIRQDDDTGSA